MHEPHRREVFALYVTFFFTGIATVLLGPLLPELAERFSLSALQLAWFFPAQFLGSALGSMAAGRHPRGCLIGGYLAMASGLAGLTLGDARICAAAFFSLGLGIGAVCTATNLRIAQGVAERRGARLAAVNFVWGGGAAVSPVFYAATRQLLGFDGALWLLASLLFACMLAIVVAVRAPAAPAPSGDATAAAEKKAPAAGFRELLPFAALFFLYTGVESAWGGWLVELAGQKEGELDPYLVGSIYWTALLIGRGIAPFGLREISERHWLRGSLFAAALGAAALLIAPSRLPIAAAGAIIGLGLAAMFPLLVSLLAAATTQRGQREAGWVFSFIGAGGATLPWLVGAATEIAGNLQLALAVPLAGLLLFAAILPIAEKRAAPPDR